MISCGVDFFFCTRHATYHSVCVHPIQVKHWRLHYVPVWLTNMCIGQHRHHVPEWLLLVPDDWPMCAERLPHPCEHFARVLESSIPPAFSVLFALRRLSRIMRWQHVSGQRRLHLMPRRLQQLPLVTIVSRLPVGANHDVWHLYVVVFLHLNAFYGMIRATVASSHSIFSIPSLLHARAGSTGSCSSNCQSCSSSSSCTTCRSGYYLSSSGNCMSPSSSSSPTLLNYIIRSFTFARPLSLNYGHQFSCTSRFSAQVSIRAHLRRLQASTPRS